MSQLALITPISGGHPDQGLPGHEGNVDPGYGVSGDRVWPPVNLPPLPPGIWPSPPLGTWPPSRPGVPSNPIVVYPPHVDQGLPPVSGGEKPDQGLPGGGSGNKPDQGLPGSQPGIDNSLPQPPATIWPPLPPSVGVAGKALLLIWIVGVGYRWLVVSGPDVWPPVPQPK
jgi:hypothetical protein